MITKMKSINLKKSLSIFVFLFIFNTAWSILNPPSQTNPSNNIRLKNFQSYLVVSQVTGVVKYEFQIDTTINFNSFRLRTLSSNKNNTPYVVTPVLLMNKNYYWRARIFSSTDSSNWTNYRMIAVDYKMDLTSPNNTSTGALRPIVAKAWHIDSSVKYIFQIDTAASFNTSQLIFRNSFSNSFLDTAYFKFGRRFFWKATAVDAEGDTLQWSDPYSYTIYTTPTTFSTIADGASAILGWSNCLSANVLLQIDISPNFNSSQLIEKTLKPGTVLDTNYNLLFGKTYYFRIKAFLGNQASNWSASRSFYIINTINIISPLNKANSITLVPQFSWTNIKHVSYQLQFASDTFFTNLIADTILKPNTTNCIFKDTLNFSSRYFWRIRAFHEKDTMVWQTNYFNTYLGQVPLTAPIDAKQDQDIVVSLQFYHFPWVDSYILEIDTGKAFTSTPSSHRISITKFNDLSPTSKSFDTILKYGNTYCWRVFGIKNGDTSDFAVSRYFVCKKRPSLSFPSNNFIGIGTYTNGLIKPMNGSHQVIWQLDTTINFNSPILITEKDSHVLDFFFTSEVLLNFPKDLRFETKYFWRAKCVLKNDTSLWSLPFNFVTTQRPWITSPANKSTNVPLSTTLTWGIQGSSSDYIYQYQWSTDSNFTNTPIVSLPKESSAEAVVTNNYGTTYYWRGRATHPKDTSLWTIRASYSSIPPPTINKPILALPLNNSTNIPTPDVDLIWNSLSNVGSYDVEISNNPDFSIVLIRGNVLGNGVTFRGMSTGTTYYWRVSGKINNFNGPWSDVWKFTSRWGTEIDEKSHLESHLKLFPNPCHDLLNIQYPSPFDISIYNNNGQLVFTQTNVPNSIQINTQLFAKGLYYVNIVSDKKIISEKVMIGKE